MTAFLIALGTLLLLPLVAVRLLILAATPLGWLNYYGNILVDTLSKKLGMDRSWIELALAAAGTVLLIVGGLSPAGGLGVISFLLLLDLIVRNAERRLLSTGYTFVDAPGQETTCPGAMAANPDLTLNLVGPFVARVPRYALGTLLVGRVFTIRLLIGNHTLISTQSPLRVSVECAAGLECVWQSAPEVGRLDSAQVRTLTLECTVRRSAGAGAIRLGVEWGRFRRELVIGFERCVEADSTPIQAANITRYPGACRSAFAWRGDMDLYDLATRQSIDGLRETLGLGARYRIAQTMYLSTRLALDEAAARAWAEHFGIDRGAEEIPKFVRWVPEEVDLRHMASYPYESKKPYVMELGNHGHLHYGTDAAAAPENGWRPNARMGAGRYAWVGEDRSSLAEQRDNALEARRWCERLFGFTLRSWAMPDRTNDAHTPTAMEAAGCDVLSDSNVSTRHNVLLQPPPHHPAGTRAVELTKRYPGDPQHIYHVAMNVYWVHRAHRLGIPVVFMCHQHMRQFDGYGCSRFTEYVLRHVLTRFHGDMHINTVFGIGKYWREVLSPQTAQVHVAWDGRRVRVTNAADMDLVDTPVDVILANGARMTLLVNVLAGQEQAFSVDGV